MGSKKIFFVSAGLGNIYRGFEVSCAAWYRALKEDTTLDIELFSGGKFNSSIQILNLPRNSLISKLLRKLKIINDGCRLEQISFSFGLLPYLFFKRPSLIWLQEGTLGEMLLKFKTLFNLEYKIIFCDGAPVGYDYAKKFDYLIFLHNKAFKMAIDLGFPREKVALIPHIINHFSSNLTKQEARKKLNLPQNSYIVICVASWNKHHKRIDYLINEFSKLAKESFTLLLCGQPDIEAQELRQLAETLLVNCHWYTLNQQELAVAYRASDAFVLSSIHEGLPAVIVEASFNKLPVICHNHDAGKFVFGENYIGLKDLSLEGALAKQIETIKYLNNQNKIGEETFDIVSRRFSREVLLHQFLEFVKEK